MRKVISIIIAVIILCLTLTACSTSKKQEEPVDKDSKYFVLQRLTEKSKYKSSDIKSYFYSDGERYAFEPSEEYVGVVPYIHSTKEFKTSSGDKIDCNIYGISTVDGQIITTGIYSGVFETSSEKGETVFVCDKSYDSDKKTVKKDIITQDGTVLIEAEYSTDNETGIVPFKGMPCECMVIPTGEGTMLYDFKGKLITNLTEAFGADCYFSIYYCDSEKIIFTAAPDYEAYQSQELEFYCMNKQGELAYKLDTEKYRPIGFEGGRFILVNSKGRKRLADVMGKTITKNKDYGSIIYDPVQKRYWCCEENGDISVINEKAEEVFSDSAKKINSPEFNILVSSDASSLFVSSKNNKKDFAWFSGKDGKKISISKKGIVDIEPIFDGKYDYVKVMYDGYADFYNAAGTYLKTISNFKSFKSSCDGKIIYLDDDDCLCISGLNVTQNFSLQFTEEQADSFHIAYFNGTVLAVSLLDGDKTLTTVYDIDAERPVIEDISGLSLFSSAKRIYCAGNVAGKHILMLEDGTKLISLSDKTYL